MVLDVRYQSPFTSIPQVCITDSMDSKQTKKQLRVIQRLKMQHFIDPAYITLQILD